MGVRSFRTELTGSAAAQILAPVIFEAGGVAAPFKIQVYVRSVRGESGKEIFYLRRKFSRLEASLFFCQKSDTPGPTEPLTGYSYSVLSQTLPVG